MASPEDPTHAAAKLRGQLHAAVLLLGQWREPLLRTKELDQRTRAFIDACTRSDRVDDDADDASEPE